MRVLVLGGGVVGACAAIHLTRRGHDVTVLDRDEGPLPTTVGEAATSWRRGIGQFDRPHALLPRGHRWLADHVPEVLRELRMLGATPFDYLRDLAPPAMLAVLDDDPADARFRSLATRRATLELAVQRVLEREPGVTVHRGARVTALVVDDTGTVPRATGATVADGRTWRADVVLDAMGRRSPQDALLRDAGVGPLPVEEVDSRFSYVGRWYAAPDGALPPIPGMLVPAGTISLLTIPSDNGTWSVVVYTDGDDHELDGIRDEDVFEAVVRAHPTHAHLVDGDPMSPVQRMVSDAGMRRTLVTDDGPRVLGLLPLGDAWASTNPSYGRGISLGLLQVDVLTDVLAAHGGDPDALARAWQATIDERVSPWWDDTVGMDRARVAQIGRLRARAAGAPVEQREPSPVAQFVRAFERAAGRHADALRALTDIAACNALPAEVLARPGLAERVMELRATPPDGGRRERRGPSREELVAIAGAGGAT